MYTLVEEVRTKLKGEAHVVGYGHLGDGNLHLNVVSEQYSDRVLGMIEPYVYEWTSANSGSISAEHGLGQMKQEHIGYSKSPLAVSLMQGIKDAFDPNHILNPYKVLPTCHARGS